MGGLPKVTVLRIADVDDGGNVWAVPDRWEADGPVPRLRVRERKRGALGIGERILARTEEAGNGWIAHPMKVLARASEQILGVLRQEGERFWLTGVERRSGANFPSPTPAARRRAIWSWRKWEGDRRASPFVSSSASAIRSHRAASR